ncbi:hypothetical protein [Syntrophotalea acetylenica]|uniref:Uncharacterized protein n=1 Tax=Syntrophotalea acetylenica TaxID=29542 RepID=A0A1L3GF80_SYNAC|nr:hypothetical protein [Syntrophotalea acetylenica]APG24622.1 hypothetical protein A7E75_05970 [Syntrophotalea acetylenica]APG45204.1 hypothetical protein A6070_14610 [Syntrophotalea acetylenica]
MGAAMGAAMRFDFSQVFQNDTERNAIDTMDNLWNMGDSRWLHRIPVWFQAGFGKKRTVFCFL